MLRSPILLAVAAVLALSVAPGAAAARDADSDHVRVLVGGHEVELPLQSGSPVDFAVTDPRGGPDLVVSLRWVAADAEDPAGGSEDDAPGTRARGDGAAGARGGVAGLSDLVVHRELDRPLDPACTTSPGRQPGEVAGIALLLLGTGASRRWARRGSRRLP